MSKLFLVHDFSPDSSALFATFSQHAPLLAESAIELAPFNPLGQGPVPTHNALWLKRPENKGLPAHIAAMWADIAEKLDSGKHVLLFTRQLDPEAHGYFWTHLHERVDMGRHRPELLFVFGRPSLMLEQYFQFDQSAPNRPGTDTYADGLCSLAITVSLIRKHAGNARCKYLLNPSESPTSTPRPEILNQAFAFLGARAPEGRPITPFAVGFRSHQARRLARALEVRENIWPPLDTAACYAALQALDRDLPQDWLAPLDLRQKFACTGADAVSALEDLAGAAPGALAPPAAFVNTPETDPAAPLSPDLARAFAEGLSPAERKPLETRLANDAALLNADQRVLLDALAGHGAFSHLGEPVPPPELTVLTMTYNHENFIAQCMDSVLAQKTNFPVRHLVLDHCSTDGTAAIVTEYARRHPSIQPVLLSRHVPNENVTGLFLRCRSKYAALCDGDDYFTEPTKLQKQVDMLEGRPDLAISFHPVAAVFDDGRPPTIFPPLSALPRRPGNNPDFYLADLLSGNFIQTNSVVYRWRFRDGLPRWFRPDLCPGDYYWHILHAETGNIGFIPEVMSVYRRHPDALYAKAFTSSKALRNERGMAELETYKACNEHFHNRCFRSFSRLAIGVFADLLQIALSENDDRLLNAAIEKYPEFGHAFLTALKEQSETTRTDAHTSEQPEHPGTASAREAEKL